MKGAYRLCSLNLAQRYRKMGRAGRGNELVKHVPAVHAGNEFVKHTLAVHVGNLCAHF